MSPQGYLSPASPQKVLVEPSPRARPMETLQWPPMVRLLSQHPRAHGVSPMQAGPYFQRGPAHVPRSALAPEKVGFSPWAGKRGTDWREPAWVLIPALHLVPEV